MSSRFGPFEKTASLNPGSSYPSAPQSGASKPLYTASIKSRKTSRYSSYSGSRKVESAPLAPVGKPAQLTPVRSYAPRATGAPRTAGKMVTVGPGDTVYGISRRNGVTVADLASTNGLAAPYTLRIVQSLRIPGGATPAYRTRNAAAPARTPASRNLRTAKAHQVRAGETLYALSRRYGVKPQQIAAYNGLAAPYTIRPGQTVRIPAGGARQAGGRSDRKTVPDYKAASTRITPARSTPTKRVATIPVPRAKPMQASRKADRAAVPKRASRKVSRGPLPRPDPRSSSKFRWPVKGKVISGFGPKAGGTRNDGINIAVPAGTSVRAADNGVVAYAGNELRGYGNLVLIRHAGGWVTAYAHNGELFVRRGVKVRRGQIIAKAGKTGSVTRPQVHFEIRKGAQAVNPLKQMTASYYAGG